ncbi:hypothetical protein GT025_05145 [Streptomyces sp. SID4920]|nr:hypothetical protein [Streptomyces sp. SID4920]MYX63883.1 hypothetical protein [Streptomyces sp. SID8373]
MVSYLSGRDLAVADLRRGGRSVVVAPGRGHDVRGVMYEDRADLAMASEGISSGSTSVWDGTRSRRLAVAREEVLAQ